MEYGSQPSCWRACIVTFMAFAAVVLVIGLSGGTREAAVADQRGLADDLASADKVALSDRPAEPEKATLVEQVVLSE